MVQINGEDQYRFQHVNNNLYQDPHVDNLLSMILQLVQVQIEIGQLQEGRSSHHPFHLLHLDYDVNLRDTVENVNLLLRQWQMRLISGEVQNRCSSLKEGNCRRIKEEELLQARLVQV